MSRGVLKSAVRLIVVGLLALALPAALRADSVIGQFSLVNNPNGNWSYGYSTSTNPFILLTFHTDYIHEFGQGLDPNSTLVLPRWIDISGSGYVLANTLGAVQTSWFTIPANVAILGPTPQINQGSVIRWTAPATGTYTINGFFQGLNNIWYPSVNTVNIMLNGNVLFSGLMDVDGPGSILPFQVTQHLQAGSNIDFTAAGTQFTYPANLIGLSAEINPTPVPEPGTMALVGMGTLGVVLRRRLMRR